MSPPTRTPDWLLERIALGELPPEALAHARARLLREPEGAARLTALEADDAATLARYAPVEVVRRVGFRARVAKVLAEGARTPS